MTELLDTKRLPLHERHCGKGAKLMGFAGWEVPVSYSTIVEEHEAVRKAAGVFDVSHMGKFRFRGRHARAFLDSLFSNGLHKISEGRAIYGTLLNEQGLILDDIIIYQIGWSEYFVVVNAGTLDKDWNWFKSHCPADVEMSNESPDKCILAVQGPASPAVLQQLFKNDFTAVKPFHFTERIFNGEKVFIAATGYTGERGFELFPTHKVAGELFDAIFTAGESLGVKPAGFGARDTLRLEASYHLYGQDMDETTTPLEAGLQWVCDFSKDFIGKKALLKQKEQGLTRRLSGFQIQGTGIARHGNEVRVEGKKVSEVTSGTFCPTLKAAVGLAYLPIAYAVPGKDIEVMVRDKALPAKTVKLPFYKR